MLEEIYNISKEEFVRMLKRTPTLEYIYPAFLENRIVELQKLYNTSDLKHLIVNVPHILVCGSDNLVKAKQNLDILGINNETAKTLQSQLLTIPTKTDIICKLNEDLNEN